jgi:hypothetical protein
VDDRNFRSVIGEDHFPCRPRNNSGPGTYASSFFNYTYIRIIYEIIIHTIYENRRIRRGNPTGRLLNTSSFSLLFLFLFISFSFNFFSLVSF